MTKLEPLLSNVYLLEHDLDGTKVRGAIVLGNTKALVWDTLIYPEGMRVILDICEGRELIVVYSHADWDHVWGTCGLPYKEVVAHERCAARFADPDDVEKSLAEYQAKYPEELKGVELVAPTRTFKDHLTLDLGGLSAELFYLPGHTQDGIVAFIPELGVLLAGDALETPLPLIYEDSPLGRWISDLEKWSQDDRVKTVIPSHGEVKDNELILYNVAYLKAMRSGAAFEIPYELDDFYSSAHARNQKVSPTLE